MMNKKTKREQIEAIKSEAEQKLQAVETEFKIKETFPDIDFQFVRTSNIVYFKINYRDQIQEVLEAFPPINKQTVLKSIGKNGKVIGSPFRVDLKNPAKINSASQFEMRISYKAEKFGVTIVLPLELYSEYVQEYRRKITDSEYHYFTGTSHKQLTEMKVKAYTFKNSNVVAWYGGQITQCDETYIKNIVNGEELGTS